MNLSKKELRNKFLKLKNENSAFKTAIGLCPYG